jgi:hypothetical protein
MGSILFIAFELLSLIEKKERKGNTKLKPASTKLNKNKTNPKTPV